MVRDQEGDLWVSTRAGFWIITPAASDSRHFGARKYSSREGLACDEMTRIYQDYNGRVWAGTDYGLFEFLKKERRFRLRLGVKDMKDARIWSFSEDRVGNLWIGTANGAIRLARNGFTTLTESDGLGFRDVYHITEPSAGEINLYTRFGDRNFFVDKFNGERFISRRVVARAFRSQAFVLYHRQIPTRDHLGEWWWPTNAGLFRYSKADRIEDIIGAALPQKPRVPQNAFVCLKKRPAFYWPF